MPFSDGAKARDHIAVGMQSICRSEIRDPAGDGVTPGGRCQLPDGHDGYHRRVRGSQVLQWLDASQITLDSS